MKIIDQLVMIIGYICTGKIVYIFICIGSCLCIVKYNWDDWFGSTLSEAKAEFLYHICCTTHNGEEHFKVEKFRFSRIRYVSCHTLLMFAITVEGGPRK